LQIQTLKMQLVKVVRRDVKKIAAVCDERIRLDFQQ